MPESTEANPRPSFVEPTGPSLAEQIVQTIAPQLARHMASVVDLLNARLARLGEDVFRVAAEQMRERDRFLASSGARPARRAGNRGYATTLPTIGAPFDGQFHRTVPSLLRPTTDPRLDRTIAKVKCPGWSDATQTLLWPRVIVHHLQPVSQGPRPGKLKHTNNTDGARASPAA